MTACPRSFSIGKEGTIVPIFEAQAARNLNAISLTLDGRSQTYGALNTRANQLAVHLRELGVKPDALVGIYLDRSFDLVAGILAVHKSGGAYLPLDLACPEDRLAFLLKDSGARFVLTESQLAGQLKGYAGKIICLDREQERIAGYSAENLAPVAEPHHLAYVIYTSGSTGTPKGVAVTQENVARLFSTTDEIFHFGAEDVWTLFHSSAFDFSVWEIFGALLYGGRLVIVPYMTSRSASAFRELLIRERVTVLNQTPSAFRQLVQADLAVPAAQTALRYVIFGGEALEYQSLRPWFERHGDQQPQCVNMYGITETTVHVTHHRITTEDLEKSGSNIGRPLPDLQVYLVNEQGQRVAPGKTGEMLVGGPGVARGYLNRPELTDERFIPNPFLPGTTSRLYRSGDLARERENGDLEYLGRNDQQVKVRGFRIELQEIESTLARHPAVGECAILSCVEAGGEPRLAAYIVARPDSKADVETLRAHLAQTLPDYMIPSDFIFLPGFPLTLNGKLDREALPMPGPERPQLASRFVEPQNNLESTLARLWKAALRRDTVGVEDNFFDLGGDSLLLTALHRQLEGELKRKISITVLFQYPTIRLLAAHLVRKDQPSGFEEKLEARAQLQRAALKRARRTAATQPFAP